LGTYTPKTDDKNKLILGYRNYELTNHLGNVLTVISDKDAQIISANDYYPFGMTIKSRSFSDGYRFGFSGQEKDTEINPNIYHAEFWKYDSRIARRWNTDPVFVPFESPYTTFRNNPIFFIDPAGNMPTNNGGDGGCPEGDCDENSKRAYERNGNKEIYTKQNGQWNLTDVISGQEAIARPNWFQRTWYNIKYGFRKHDDKPVPNPKPGLPEKIIDGVFYTAKTLWQANSYELEAFSSKGGLQMKMDVFFLVEQVNIGFKYRTQVYGNKFIKEVGSASLIPNKTDVKKGEYQSELSVILKGYGGQLVYEETADNKSYNQLKVVAGLGYFGKFELVHKPDITSGILGATLAYIPAGPNIGGDIGGYIPDNPITKPISVGAKVKFTGVKIIPQQILSKMTIPWVKRKLEELVGNPKK